MTPMIDMVFLLLVFFMTVSTMASAERLVKLDLAKSETSEVPDDPALRRIVSVDAAGRIHVGTRIVERDALGDMLKQALGGEPDLSVLVRADRQTAFADIRKVLRVCAESGAYEVIYATHQERTR